jgi:hypothetical protein
MKFQRVIRLAVIVLLGSVCLLTIPACETFRKGMDSLKSMVKIYDTYEQPVSDIGNAVVRSRPNEEETD